MSKQAVVRDGEVLIVDTNTGKYEKATEADKGIVDQMVGGGIEAATGAIGGAVEGGLRAADAVVGGILSAILPSGKK